MIVALEIYNFLSSILRHARYGNIRFLMNQMQHGMHAKFKWAGKWGCTNKIQDAEAQMQCPAKTNSALSNNINPMAIDDNTSKINYFLSCPNQDTDRRASAKIILQLQKEFKDVFYRK